MMKKTKLALLATIVALGLSSPALAQSSNSGLAAAKELLIGYGVNSDENGVRWHSRPQFHVARSHGRTLYDVAPSNPSALDPNSTTATGGGSLGYNQMLLID
jgi:hypothetical protein